jgi:hypothetical protein
MRAPVGWVLTLTILSSPGCYKTKLVGIDQALASRRAWLTLSDQSVVLVYGPKIYGNKLVGFVEGKYQEFPTADLKEARVREPDGARTAALVAASVLAVGGFTYALLPKGSSYALPPDYCDAPEHADEPMCEGQ